MKTGYRYLLIFILLSFPSFLAAQTIESENGDRLNPDGRMSKAGSRDTTSHRQTPRGMTVWTVDEITGQRYEAEPDTASYLRMNHLFASGLHGEYNTLGNNGTPRLNRIFIDREKLYDYSPVNGYSQVLTIPQKFHFTNTYSPITNLDFNECGTMVTGEDHLKATFAVNVNKQIGIGFKIDYLYARGYYANQNTSHFCNTLWGSYLGDRYQAHLLLSTNHQKQTENGGILNDNYIKHPETEPQSFIESDIPTALSSNWNINDNHHIFFNQRYSIGFNRRVPMTEKEKEAKRFAMEAAKEKAEREARRKAEEDGIIDSGRPLTEIAARPDNTKVLGDEPAAVIDSTKNQRIAMTAEQAKDSIAAAKQKNLDDPFMKNEYVPVTSFFHTAQVDFFRRNYKAYATPSGYYANDFYGYPTDSINDKFRHTYIRNNVGMALLEGFNKWAKAGINIYAAHEFRYVALPLADRSFYTFTENNMRIGAQIIKKQGRTLHFDAKAELCPIGNDNGEFTIDGNTDLNIPLLGDTLRFDAKASLSLLNPDTYLCTYKSRHFEWDNDFNKEKHLHIEGNLSYPKTGTHLRVAFDNIASYTYYATSYSLDSISRVGNIITPRQASQSIQVLTAQLFQNFHFGIWHWDNIVSFQKTSDDIALPLPQLNVYSNMYLRFRIARVLNTDFGADVRYFTEYNAPEYCPSIQQYAVQENEAVRTKVGNYPIVNVYINCLIKSCRFYLMMSHVNCSGKGNYFLTPHHPLNGRVLRFGVNWNFFN